MEKWFVMLHFDVCKFEVHDGEPCCTSGYTDYVIGNKGFRTKKESEKMARRIKN